MFSIEFSEKLCFLRKCRHFWKQQKSVFSYTDAKKWSTMMYIRLAVGWVSKESKIKKKNFSSSLSEKIKGGVTFEVPKFGNFFQKFQNIKTRKSKIYKNSSFWQFWPWKKLTSIFFSIAHPVRSQQLSKVKKSKFSKFWFYPSLAISMPHSPQG